MIESITKISSLAPVIVFESNGDYFSFAPHTEKLSCPYIFYYYYRLLPSANLHIYSAT